MRLSRYFLGILFLFFTSSLFAKGGPLDLVLTQGVSSSIPVAVVPFSGQDDSQPPNNISSVIVADLQNSGQFKVMDPKDMTQKPHQATDVDLSAWRQAKVDAVAVGSVQAEGDNYRISFALVNVFHDKEQTSNQVLASQTMTVPAGKLRAAAHRISDIIYQQLTGVRGIFSTKIAYVMVQRTPGQRGANYVLQVADVDGFNPKPLLTSRQPIMSPTWSHDGKQIAYVSFENITSQIYVQNVMTGARRVVSSFPRINGAPAWSPDDSKLAIVLSKTGHPKIYSLDLAGGEPKQLTQGTSIDTEPNWAPDGNSIIFTSDRGGGPQIYQLTLASGEVKRLTFNGSYNARGSFTPDGQKLVMIHREPGSMYDIATQDLASGALQTLSLYGYDASPTVSPNGRMVLYESDASRRGVLGMVSIDGKIKLHVPADSGSVQDPSWSPFLS